MKRYIKLLLLSALLCAILSVPASAAQYSDAGEAYREGLNDGYSEYCDYNRDYLSQDCLDYLYEMNERILNDEYILEYRSFDLENYSESYISSAYDEGSIDGWLQATVIHKTYEYNLEVELEREREVAQQREQAEYESKMAEETEATSPSSTADPQPEKSESNKLPWPALLVIFLLLLLISPIVHHIRMYSYK